MDIKVSPPELGFVALTESKRDVWRQARAGRDGRVTEILERNREDYARRNYGLTMPAVVEREIRQHAEAEQDKTIARLQTDMLGALEAAKTTIATVRKAHERVLPPWQQLQLEPLMDDTQVSRQRGVDEAAQANAARLIQDGALGPIVDWYLRSSDTQDWALVLAVEEAIELQMPKFVRDITPNDLAVVTRLRSGIRARQQARWPQWTHEADARVRKTLTTSEDAIIRLQAMRVIA